MNLSAGSDTSKAKQDFCFTKTVCSSVAVVFRKVQNQKKKGNKVFSNSSPSNEINKLQLNTTQLLLLGKFEYGGGPIFKVVLEC